MSIFQRQCRPEDPSQVEGQENQRLTWAINPFMFDPWIFRGRLERHPREEEQSRGRETIHNKNKEAFGTIILEEKER